MYKNLLRSFFFVLATPAFLTPVAQAQAYGPSTILPQCIDKSASSPTFKSRECTRIYCLRQDYKELVESFALGKPITVEQQTKAITCIARKEQDFKGNQ